MINKIRELEKWQKRRLAINFFVYLVIFVSFLAIGITDLAGDRKSEKAYWNMALAESQEMTEEVAKRSKDAVEVSVGTYIENLKEIAIKNSYYRLVVQVWFRWEGDADLDMKNHFRVYKGIINKTETIKEYAKDGVNYQLLRCDVSVTKDYWAKRFPLESHQLRMYITSNYPVEKVVFREDAESSGLNQNLSIAGYEIVNHDTAIVNIKQDGTHGDPELTEDLIIPEHLTAIELNRNGWGLYTKCFIALVGTITWVLIALFLSTYHRVDPLGMIPAALFGTVTNIMVGANLLPDALQFGLLEYVNIFGIITILAVTLTIININRIRNKFEDRAFAGLLGRIMFVAILTITIAGNILLPLSAYMS